jgi:hypothetical protein
MHRKRPARLPSPPRSDERADDGARHEELDLGREASGSVPATAAVKELAPTWAQEREHVLEIGRGAGQRSERARIQRAARHHEERETGSAAGDLEAARMDVLVWDAITGEVKDRPQEQRAQPCSARRTSGGARCNVKRDDHRSSV